MNSELLILHVIDSLGGSGGSERQLIVNLQQFRRPNLIHAVALLYDLPGSRASEIPPSVTIEVLFPDRKSVPGLLASVIHLRRLVLRLRPDVIHGSVAAASLAARLVGWLTRTPVVESLVNIAYEQVRTTDNPHVTSWKLALHRWREKATVPAVSHFHAVSETVAQSWSKDLSIPRTRMTVIPRGLPFAAPRNLDRSLARKLLVEELGLDEEAVIILNVARHEPQKGQRYAIEAMAELHQGLPNAVLLIAGRNGTATPLMEATVERLALEGKVRLLGTRTDIPHLLSAADIFVFPSLFEGSGGNALLEAMAAGIPTVSIDRPPMTELATNEVDALMVPPQDPRALAQAILRLVREPELAERLTATAREKATTMFDPAEVAGRLEDLYARVAGPRKIGTP